MRPQVVQTESKTTVETLVSLVSRKFHPLQEHGSFRGSKSAYDADGQYKRTVRLRTFVVYMPSTFSTIPQAKVCMKKCLLSRLRQARCSAS